MPLEIQLAVPSDAHAFTHVFFSAFHPEDPFECLIYPYGATPKAVEHEYKNIFKNFQDPHVQYLKIIDTEIAPDENGNEIIAFARWKIWREERPKEVWDVSWGPQKPDLSNTENGIIDDVDVALEEVFFEKLQEMRRKYIKGMPCVYMSMLCTRPTHERRRAASILLKWGLDLADREGLVIFAQCSPKILSSGGASKNDLSFEAAEAWSLDVEKLGKDGIRIKWPMVKTLVKRNPRSVSDRQVS